MFESVARLNAAKPSQTGRSEAVEQSADKQLG
jgi:hypothetical protein